VAGLSGRAQQTLEDLDASLVRVQHLVEGGRYDLETALENLRLTSENLRDLTDTARPYPSLLILGEPPQQSEIPPR
jgi:phospholipid/cholesterol/gamma-HCH transport system substrate-binding protein/paraquat-inducible protein B